MDPAAVMGGGDCGAASVGDGRGDVAKCGGLWRAGGMRADNDRYNPMNLQKVGRCDMMGLEHLFWVVLKSVVVW